MMLLHILVEDKSLFQHHKTLYICRFYLLILIKVGLIGFNIELLLLNLVNLKKIILKVLQCFDL